MTGGALELPLFDWLVEAKMQMLERSHKHALQRSFVQDVKDGLKFSDALALVVCRSSATAELALIEALYRDGHELAAIYLAERLLPEGYGGALREGVPSDNTSVLPGARRKRKK